MSSVLCRCGAGADGVTKNREGPIEHDVVVALFNEIVAMTDDKGWLSGEQFSVDGTLVLAWAGHRSFVRKGGNDDGDGTDFRCKSRSNDMHASTTDPEARLYHKGKTTCEHRYMDHKMTDNRHGPIEMHG